MNQTADSFEKVAVVARLAELDKNMGRTALMKYAYLLQTVRGVPLGYDFSLFTYGPFDAEVLSSNTYAKHLGAVIEVPVNFSTGTRMELAKGPNAGEVMEIAGEFVKRYDSDIQWVAQNFKRYNAGEMELLSTLVYAYGETKSEGKTVDDDHLIDTVLKIKPHFTKSQAEKLLGTLHELGIVPANKTDE